MFDRLKPYERYGTAPGPWIPAMPTHWQIVPGAAAFKPVTAKNSGLVEPTVLSLSYGQVIIKPAEKLRGLIPESFETYQVLEPGDIVVRPTDLQNDKTSLRVGHVRDRGIITSAYLGMRASGVSDSYAFAYLAALDHMKVFYGMGSGLRQNLDLRDFRRLPTPVPPADEQTAIVKYLGHAQARIDRAIATKRQLIALLEEQKRVVVTEALNSAPEGQRALRHVLRSLVDCEHKTAPYTADTEWRILRTSAVRNGAINWEGSYTTDEASYRKWTSRAVPEPGDVIFTREAPVGEAAVIPAEVNVALGQRTVLMKVRREVMDPQFLVHQIYGGSPRARINVATQGSTVGHFNMDDIGWMRVSVPDLKRQRELVDEIARANSKTDGVLARTRREIELLREFRTRLTSDVVTGQVDVREIAAILPEQTEDALPDIDDQLYEALDAERGEDDE